MQIDVRLEQTCVLTARVQEGLGAVQACSVLHISI